LRQRFVWVPDQQRTTRDERVLRSIRDDNRWQIEPQAVHREPNRSPKYSPRSIFSMPGNLRRANCFFIATGAVASSAS
jgi:hypothetical protein